jgi:hypothetical protein
VYFNTTLHVVQSSLVVQGMRAGREAAPFESAMGGMNLYLFRNKERFPFHHSER